MYCVDKAIWINCVPKAAFDLHANHANRVEWHDHVVASIMTSPPPVRAGSLFDLEVIAAGRHVPMQIEITAFDPYHSYTYRSTTMTATSYSTQNLVVENGGTRFSVHIELQFHGLARPFGWFILKFNLERHFGEALAELKQKLEGG
jgi:hypothetical protein